MAQHLDFKLYLDSANQSVTRTRNSIYLLLTIFVALLAVYVNTTVLDWSGQRMLRMRKAYECVSHPELWDNQCVEAVRYAGDLGLPPEKTSNGVEINKEYRQDLYREYRNAMIRRRTDLRTIQLPLFGAVLDLNDLGLLSAFLFLILLIILRTNLYHEFEALESARQRAEIFRKDKQDSLYEEASQLLESTQVLASPKRHNRGFRWSAMVVMSLPIVLHALIIKHDLSTVRVANDLVGPTSTIVLSSLEVLALLAMLWVWYLNTRVWLRLAYLFHVKDTPRILQRLMKLESLKSPGGGNVEIVE